MGVLECRRCELRWPEHHYRMDTIRQWQEKESHAIFCALCEAEQMEDKRLDEIYICGEAMNTEHEPSVRRCCATARRDGVRSLCAASSAKKGAHVRSGGQFRELLAV